MFSECKQLDTDLQLPDQIQCSIPSHCTALNCCVHVPLIDRSIPVSVDINACVNSASLTIGEYSETVSLLSYEWGTWNKLNLKGVLAIE